MTGVQTCALPIYLIIAVRITADVSVTVLGCTPFLDGTCQMQGGILWEKQRRQLLWSRLWDTTLEVLKF